MPTSTMQRHRIVKVDDGATAEYKYDHQNRRVTKVVGSSWTHYIWEGAQVIGEHDGTTPLPGYGQPPYQEQSARLDYIYSGRRMIHSRQRASSTAPWTTQYYLRDRLSVRITLDSSGNVSGRQAHLPLGEDFGESGLQEKRHFTSYERDGESGTDYALNRQYAPDVGRFMRVDPLFGPPSDHNLLNVYAYGRNDPVNTIDPQGLTPLTICFWYEETEPDFEQGLFLEGCETYDLPTRPERGPLTPPDPCDVQVPTDANDRAMIAVILGEATPRGYLGSREYGTDQHGLVRRIGGPTGPVIIEETLFAEMISMIAVVDNRLASGRWQDSWEKIASSGEFLGYAKGKRLLDSGRYGAKGSPICEQIRMAIEAIQFHRTIGSFDKRILYWKAVVQGSGKNTFVRPWETGDLWRWGRTDFSTHN